jgi:glucose-6-phosphate-specific signal transduction histidine kinase
MQTSEDYFLIRLGAILIPTALLLIFSVIISYSIIKRYRKAVKRLYQMNFKGVETERKRIANDMHDQVGFTIMQVRNSLHEVSEKVLASQALEQIKQAQHLIGDLHLSLRQLIENVYPRELMESNWNESFKLLATGMSLGNKYVEMDIEVESELSTKQLHQMFRLTQEMLANIFTHAKVERVTMQIYEEDNIVMLSFTYKSNWVRIPIIKRLHGRGTFIIKERMRLLEAKYKKYYKDGYKHETIYFLK